MTVHNQYPLPLIADLILDLSNAHLYTKLNIRWVSRPSGALVLDVSSRYNGSSDALL